MHNQNKYISMWSTIRSLSTAMMRAWESRPDTIVKASLLKSFGLLLLAYGTGS